MLGVSPVVVNVNIGSAIQVLSGALAVSGSPRDVAGQGASPKTWAAKARSTASVRRQAPMGSPAFRQS